MIDGLANLDAVCSATASRTEGGWRALDLRAWDGIDARLLPDRGLDCFGAWYRGVPLAWVSAVGERGPLGGRLRDDDWLLGFGGGLVATCGLRNVGAPSEGHGLHGEISHQPAREVRVARWVDGEQAVVSASGAVAEVSALGHRLELERTWTTRTGEGRLELVDVTRNLGRDPEPAPLLYHVNLGAPLWSAGATLALDARATTPRDEDAVGPWDRALEPIAGCARARLRARGRRRRGRVVRGDVDSPATGLRLTLRWEAAGLPRLHQWVHPAPGIAVLGLEPANCSVLGRAADRAAGRLPVLEPGEERVTRLEVRVAGTLGGLRQHARDELAAAAHADLLEDRLQVVLHGVARDEQAVRDLARVEALDQQRDELALARAETVRARDAARAPPRGRPSGR